MKKNLFSLIILLFIASCTPLVHHSDPFYDFNDSDFPRDQLPLLNPIKATRESSSSPWEIGLINIIWIDIPKSIEKYPYSYIMEVEKIDVIDNAIFAYSSYVDKQAEDYVFNNYFHWFVIVPNKKITKGFHSEDEFNEYIKSLGMEFPDWQTPDELFAEYAKNGGCLDWIPDCNQK
jgi:hypothetical protein